jgi:hypothetical protein
MKMLLRYALWACVFAAASAAAQSNFLLRPSTSAALPAVTQKYNLTVVEPVDTQGQVYLVQGPANVPPQDVETEVGSDDNVTSVEPDQSTGFPEVQQSTAAILDSLPTPSAVSYYGSSVLAFYTTQPAVNLMRLPGIQALGVTGKGVVAVIDTGIDPSHPVLSGSIVAGYDFVNNLPGTGSEWIDLDPANLAALQQSSVSPANKNTVALVSQSTAAILDQSTAAILDYNNLPHAFGHGTMVAGVVHLAAPTAQIMPLKAFHGDGTANLSDILRAVYYAADNGASVINMSFTLTAPSKELANALQYAASKGVICVAAAGNDGKQDVGNPANLEYVMGVASTSNTDVLSVFSSYGRGVFLAAPGEGIVTTYPGSNYAEATGTSFSSPFVAGAGSLALQFAPSLHGDDLREAMGTAKHLKSKGIGHGRLDFVLLLKALKD